MSNVILSTFYVFSHMISPSYRISITVISILLMRKLNGRDTLLRNIRQEKLVQALWPPLEGEGVSGLAELTIHAWQLF